MYIYIIFILYHECSQHMEICPTEGFHVTWGLGLMGYGTLSIDIFPYFDKHHGVSFIAYTYCTYQLGFLRNVRISILYCIQ